MNDIASAPKGVVSLDDKESGYLRGGNQPIAGSLLLSTSKYLNNPLFRDIYSQMGLQRLGHDVPAAYLVPDAMRAVDELADYAKLFERIEAARQKIPEFAQWLDARFVSDLSPDMVKDCAPGTLGARVHDFISASGMQIDFMFLAEPKNDYEYINKRRVQTHDILHMVTGLDPSPVGEIGLIIANTIANANYFDDDELLHGFELQAIMLATSSLMRSACHYPGTLQVMLEGYARGYALGSKQKKPLFMINWEPYFDWKMRDIREEFSFQDGPADGAWDWTATACVDAK